MDQYITILGSGTSHGVPMIGCHCAVCRSVLPQNKRTRSSLYIRYRDTQLVVDTTTDFRCQALREDLDRLDAVFFTHAHADHVHGLDDIRPLTYRNSIPVYGNDLTIKETKKRFSYIFKKTQIGGGKPHIRLRSIKKPMVLGGLEITPIPVMHGNLPIFGYRFNDMAYVTDCSHIPDSSFHLLTGLRTLILGTLRYKRHPTHFNLNQSLEVVRRLVPQKCYLTHMSHRFEHDELTKTLPRGVAPAWDGMRILLG